MAKRTPEEIRAQREAFLAAKAARAAGKADGTPAPAPPRADGKTGRTGSATCGQAG